MTSSDEKSASPLKVLTYNVHSCRGTDRKLDIARIAAVIGACNADIIALQELDVGRRRTGGFDQAHEIAALLEMQAHFHPALHVEEEKYGDAVLTALPSRLIKADALPSIGEPRGALWLEIIVDGTPVHVFNTHLGLRRGERLTQIKTLLGPDWLGHDRCRDLPRILMGDFNTVPSARGYKTIAANMRDAGVSADGRRRPTFPARFPLLRLDHIFISRELAPIDTAIDTSRLARLASDHLPLSATLKLGANA
jgi:endonuclease/exonuclease/phosphatase family metal-dependent hydrolase